MSSGTASASGCEDAPAHESGRHSHAGMALQLFFLAFAVGLYFALAGTDQLRTLGIVFVSIVFEAFPFMLLGALVGGLIEAFIPRERVASLLPGRSVGAIFVAAALGMLFPVCECAIVPVVRRLLRKGVPLGVAVAYLLGGPIVNPLVAGSTLVAYSFMQAWLVVLMRLAFGYAIAVTIGVGLQSLFTREQALVPEADGEAHACGCGHDHATHHAATLGGKLRAAVGHAAEDFFSIGQYLVVGAFLAGVLQILVSRQTFAAAMGVPAVSIFVMMVLAVMLSLCSEADAFVAASFRGFAPLSAQLAFMVLGPMLDIKLLLMYVKVFRKRMIIALACTTFLAVLVCMLLVEYARDWFA